jgi:adenylate kinase
VVNVVLLGPPGAGKGTQAPIVAEAVGGKLVSTGELLRQEVRQGSPHGVLAGEYMNRGELVPDDVVLDLVMHELASKQAGASFVLDGFPRNVNQARALDQALAASGQQVDHAISIDVPRQVLLDRLGGRLTGGDGGAPRRRPDDRQQTVERRLDVYNREAEPLREYYRQRQLLREVNGDRPVADVTREILQTLGRESAQPQG